MPPPHRTTPHRAPPHAALGGVPSSAIAAAIEPLRIDQLLEPWVPDAEERAFVVRCMLGEGPMHHRGASYALLLLLGMLMARLGPPSASPKPAARGTGDAVPVPLRLPPHTAPHRDGDDHYPLEMPLAPLERIAPRGSPELAAIVDCLLDGPPHHALANAAMVCLIDALFQRFDERGS